MAKVLVTESHLVSIANAIRSKAGTSSDITPSEMASAINALSTITNLSVGGKSITSNGTYLPASDSLDYFSQVVVDVPNNFSASDEGKVVNSGALVAQTSTEFTSNGTYNTTTNNEVTVNVSGGGGSANLGTKNITENGTYNASSDNYDGYSLVTVAVPSSGGGSSDIPQLPSTYQAVEYIEFTQHACYQVTIPSTASWEIQVTTGNDVSSSEKTAFGNRGSSQSNKDFQAGLRSGKITGWIRSASLSSQFILNQDGEQTAEANTKYTMHLIYYGLNTSAYIGMFSTYSASTYCGWNGKIHYIMARDIYTGELLAYFMPCYRKSDNAIGFYELVSGTFYSSLDTTGGGSVSKGADK